VPGYLAGIMLMGGPALGAAAAGTRWGVIPALAAVPWAIGGAARPWSGSVRRRLGSAAGTIVAIGVIGVYLPLAIFIPIVAAGLWALVGSGRRLGMLARAAVATIAALPLLVPWLLYADLGGLLTAGERAFWSPALVLVLALGVVILAVVIAGDGVFSAIGAWGGLLAVLGAAIARLGTFGSGAEVEASGELLAALGVALVVGAMFEVATRRRRLPAAPGRLAVVGALAATFLVLSTLLLGGPGRAGLPGDRYTGVFDFAVPTDGPASRVLLFGVDVPGDSRLLAGLPYRVFEPPYPTMLDSALNDPRLGDDALAALLQDLLDGKVRRVGESLAQFGIGWVAFTEPSPLQQLFEAQLDMVALRSLDLPVYRNEVASAVAVDFDGKAWVESGTGYRSADGSQANSVVVADNADYRWGPGTWEQSDWRNLVGAPGSQVQFKPYEPRRMMAIGAGVWLVLLAGAWGLGRLGREGA
jgi:hypothetical protein